MSINLLPEEMTGEKKEPVEKEPSPQEEKGFEIQMTRPSPAVPQAEKLGLESLPQEEQTSKASFKLEDKPKPPKISFNFLSKLKGIFREILKPVQKVSQKEKKDEPKGEEESSRQPTVEKKVEGEEIREKKAPEESKGLGVSLMPREIPVTERMVRERILMLIAVILIIVFVVGVSWYWLKWRVEVAQEQVNQIKNEMLTLETQIKQYSSVVSQAKILEAKASRVDSLFRNHIYWTNFFTFLEKYTVPDVYFRDFSAEPGNKLILSAVGRDLLAVAKQLIAFSNAPEFVKEVKISNVSGGIGGVTFRADLIFTEGIFNK